MRRKLLFLILTAVPFLFSCDKEMIMDLDPPQPGFLWRVNTNEKGGGGTNISKISPYDGTVVKRIETPFSRDLAYDITAGDGKVWVSGRDLDDGVTDYIWEANSGHQFIIPNAGQGIAFDGAWLWLVVGVHFYRIDPVTEESELVYILQDLAGNFNCEGLTYFSGFLWILNVHNESDPQIMQFDPTNGTFVNTFGCPVSNPRGLAWDGEAFWTNQYDSEWIYRFDIKNNEILGYIKPSDLWRSPHHPYGLCFEPVEEGR